VELDATISIAHSVIFFHLAQILFVVGVAVMAVRLFRSGRLRGVPRCRPPARQEWRAAIADDEYRILRGVEDPDTWGGDLGYHRLSSSAGTKGP
jgi:hypothetical protein